jgi:hypothetical protein
MWLPSSPCEQEEMKSYAELRKTNRGIIGHEYKDSFFSSLQLAGLLIYTECINCGFALNWTSCALLQIQIFVVKPIP